MAEVLDRLQSISTKVENDWAQSALARIEDENDIGKSRNYAVLPSLIMALVHSGRFSRVDSISLERTEDTAFYRDHDISNLPICHCL